MHISKLSPELQELCHKRQKEQGNDGTFMGDLIQGKANYNFTWSNTPEGDMFWSKVNEGKDMTHSEHYPKKQTYDAY